ncbi:receptor-type tyrosine-protein phosphatase F-like isoform X2 [Dysidea avara]|uniref:receptor-type tyrosine-protein phosphatase F-like isoform X2 n=1 Tax=Dysidea avara TaxID=196820 RepID=UPI00332B0579
MIGQTYKGHVIPFQSRHFKSQFTKLTQMIVEMDLAVLLVTYSLLCACSTCAGESGTLPASVLLRRPPDPPDQLALLSLLAYQAQVSWVQPFDGNDPVVVFHILVWNNDVNFTVNSTSPIILFTNLQPNMLYWFQVKAENGIGVGNFSEAKEFVTLSLPPPSPPGNVTVKLIGITSVNISWQIPVFNSSVGKILYTYVHSKVRNIQKYKRFINEWIVCNETSIVINTLAKGTDYFIKICLGNKVGKGPCEVKMISTLTTVPSVPVVKTQTINMNTIQVTWEVEDDGGNPSLDYSLRVSTDINSVGELILDNIEVEHRQSRVKNLMPGTSYWFNVVAHSSSGDSDMGWSIETTTSPYGSSLASTHTTTLLEYQYSVRVPATSTHIISPSSTSIADGSFDNSGQKMMEFVVFVSCFVMGILFAGCFVISYKLGSQTMS